MHRSFSKRTSSSSKYMLDEMGKLLCEGHLESYVFKLNELGVATLSDLADVTIISDNDLVIQVGMSDSEVQKLRELLLKGGWVRGAAGRGNNNI
jgi:hypothetical protein